MSKLFKDGVLNSLLVTVFLVIIIGSTLLYIPTLYIPTVQKNSGVVNVREKIATELKVVVTDKDGNVKYSFTKPDDLITKQFIDYFSTVFSSAYASTADVILKNDAGTDKTFRIYTSSTTVTGTIGDSASGTLRKGGIIGIGTGTTAPARSNYALETKVESYADIVTNPVWDTTTGIVSATASITITGSRTITEACIGVRWIDTSNSEQVIIFAHDTFADVSVVATDVFSLTYAFTLSSGFTDNTGILIRETFISCADGSSAYTAYKTLANNAVTIYSYRNSYTSQWFHNSGMMESGGSKISMGTSSTALARTDYKCGTVVENYASPVIITDTTGFNINGIIFSSTARTIKEVAIYTQASGITMIHLLTGDVALNAKEALVIKIRVDM